MKKKTIICLRGRHDSGKTTSIREVYKLITGNYPVGNGDFKVTFKHPQLGNIGFSSWGDPGANEEPLEEILPKNCDKVITACRSSGQTVVSVENLAKKYNYQVYYVYLIHGEWADTMFHSLFIKMNAQAVLEMIKII